MRDDTIVRRMMSVDFELPSWVFPLHTTDDGEQIRYAPLFFLQKGSDNLPPPSLVLERPPPHFADFDLRGPAGGAMSLPPRSWNASVSVQAMKVAFEEGARAHGIACGPPESLFVFAALDQIARSERNEAVGLLGDLLDPDRTIPEFVALSKVLSADSGFAWLVSACSVASVAMVPLVGVGAGHGIVKLAYSQEVVAAAPWRLLRAAAGFRGYEIWFDAPFIGARTYHVEIPAPDGLEILDAGLVAVNESEAVSVHNDAAKPKAAEKSSVLHRASGFAQQVHLYVDDAKSQHGAFAWVRLRARRREFVPVALAISLLITGVLWAAYGLTDQVRDSPTGVAALLLLFPGAVAAYAVRAGRHALTARLLFVARGLLLIVSTTPYVAAAALALTPREQGQLVGSNYECWWFWLAVGASVCTVGLILGHVMPQPKIRWQQATARLSKDYRRRKDVDDWKPWFVRPSRWWLKRRAAERLTGTDPGRPPRIGI